MLRVFVGWDKRQPISFNVLQHSIIRRSSIPVCITPLVIDQLPIKRVGLTDFSWSRFIVPYLCDFKGGAVFMDSDMLCLTDVAEFDFGKMIRGNPVARVVKNEQTFEWASLIWFNCAACTDLTPRYVEEARKLHTMEWIEPSRLGDLPLELNHLVGYSAPRPDAKIIHFTQGLPIYPETDGSEYAQAWRDEHKAMNFAEPWVELMGRSVHAAQTRDGRLVAKLHRDAVR